MLNNHLPINHSRTPGIEHRFTPPLRKAFEMIVEMQIDKFNEDGVVEEVIMCGT
jgi:hypothetical protein